jgi:Leucine-rich repeat (LRR) protein
MDNALTWSKDNKKIERAIMERGYDKDTTMNVNFIRKQYTELDLTCCEVTELDPGLLQFPNLTSLVASQNSITRLKNLPPTLEECIVSQNQLSQIDASMHLPNLTYLNVSSNHLDCTHLGTRD